MKSETTIVIGGGLIGLSTAYHLARRKAGRIILLEKGRVGDGSSSRAAGIGTQLMWSETGVRARQFGLRIFREFSQEWDGFTFHGERGCLNLFSQEGWASRRELLPLYDRLDAPYEVLDPTEVRRRWPVLSPPNDCIALHDPRGGYSEPSELVPALLRQARELGVEICEGEPVHEFILHGERVTGVRTSVRSLKADHVVSTVHVWSLPLWRETGYRVPIKHFVHQRYLSRPMSQPFESPPVNADPFCGYVRPADGNRILMGVETPDREEYRVKDLAFDMNEVCVTDEVREAGRNRLSQLVPSLSDVEWESQRVGLISFSYDGEPILGPVQRIPGLYVAASFHSGGYSYSAVAGRLMAEFVTDGNASMDISAFSPDRFDTAVTQNHLSETIAQRCAIRRRH